MTTEASTEMRGASDVPMAQDEDIAVGVDLTSAAPRVNSPNVCADTKELEESSKKLHDGPRLTCSVPVAESGHVFGASTAHHRYRLSWEDITYEPKPGKKIIDGVSGWAEPGELLAIMGPSGAGKSTVLDILADRLKRGTWTGKLCVNGQAVNERYRQIASYCMQDDALHAALSVRENILYSALLHLPGIPVSEVNRRVDAIVSEFGLERVKGTAIGNAIIRGVSGGERRRVSIACEVVADPAILLLDEPTSGLDSVAAYEVCNILRRMAQTHHKTIIATIHQPSTATFEQFDRLLLLARGCTVYYGPRHAAPQYFEGVGHAVPTFSNPADHYLAITNTDFAQDKEEGQRVLNKLTSGYRTYEATLPRPSDELTNGIALTSSSHTEASSGRQALILLQRMFVDAVRNLGLYWVRVAMYVGMALLMGAAWWAVGLDQSAIANRLSAHFFAVAFLCFMAVAAVPAFIEEFASYKREVANGAYGPGAYAFASFCIGLPFVLLIALVFTAIAYPMVGLHPGAGPFFTYVAFLYLGLLAAEGMTVAISALLPNFIVALAIAAFANGFFMVMGGFLVQTESLPSWLQWANYLSYQKYPFEGIVSNDFDGLNFNCASPTATNPSCSCIYPPSQSNPCVSNGSAVLDVLGYGGVDLWKWALVMVGFVLFWRLAFYGLLRFHVGHRR